MKRISTIILLFAIALLATFGLSLSIPHAENVIAQTPSPNSTQNSQINTIDRIFVMKAGQGGLGNIQLGQLALKKSNDATVKAFANAEIQEQTQIKNKLTEIAPKLGIQLPTTPSDKFQAVIAKLSQLNDEQFNTAYMDEGGINAHLENAALFQREVAFGQNPDLVSLANQGLPTISQHFNIASQATNYQFAQVSRQYNNLSSFSSPRLNNTNNNPNTSPNNSR